MNYLIPNFVVRGGSDNISLINQMKLDNVISDVDADKVLLIFKYLFANTTQSNTVNLTLEDMIIDCGFVPRANKNGINHKFKSILDYLNKNNYFSDNDIDFMSIKQKEFIKVHIDYFECDNKGNRIKYFMLTDEEIDDIYNIADVDCKKLLLYFSTLKSRIYNSVSDADMKAQVCYANVETMSNDTLLSESTIGVYNEILVDNDLIYKDNAGKFTKVDGARRIYKQSNNTYTLTSIANYKEEVKSAIKSHIQYMKKFDWKLCKDTNMSKREIAGTINKLRQLEKEGKLSKENKKKLRELQEQQNIITDSKKWDNKELLEKNEGSLLSQIFADKELDTLSEQYADIENELGLVNDNLKLQVDFDYYKWIITEYNQKEHDYYKNMVAKKVKEIKKKEKEEMMKLFS